MLRTEPDRNMRTIEGRLLMADFNEQGARFRVHPSIGNPVFCQFDDAQKEQVLASILGFVRITGDATIDPATGAISSIKIREIETLNQEVEDGVDMSPRGSAVEQSYWENLALEELIQRDNVKPLERVEDLFGTWPGDEDDGFEEAIANHRGHRNNSETTDDADSRCSGHES